MQLGAALSKLHERERKVLALYYEEELTMAEIARVLGLSESRISQLRSLALSRLRTGCRRAQPAGPGAGRRPQAGAPPHGQRPPSGHRHHGSGSAGRVARCGGPRRAQPP